MCTDSVVMDVQEVQRGCLVSAARFWGPQVRSIQWLEMPGSGARMICKSAFWRLLTKSLQIVIRAWACFKHYSLQEVILPTWLIKGFCFVLFWFDMRRTALRASHILLLSYIPSSFLRFFLRENVPASIVEDCNLSLYRPKSHIMSFMLIYAILYWSHHDLVMLKFRKHRLHCSMGGTFKNWHASNNHRAYKHFLK